MCQAARYGGNGFDILRGSGGEDRLEGNAGADRLLGGNGRDSIFGGNEGDLLVGGDGADLLRGEDGDDLLFGIQGNDTLFGGNGADAFALSPLSGRDTIVDFQDGQDLFSTEFDLTFEQLEIFSEEGKTTIAIAETGEVLATVEGVAVEAISEEDFIDVQTPVDDETPTGPLEPVVPTIPESVNSLENLNTNDSLSIQTEATSETVGNGENSAPIEIGAVTSQGVEALNVNQARNLFDVDGSGVKVGVLSNSYNRNVFAATNASDDIASGDLPGEGNPNGYTTPVTVLDDSADNSNLDLSDEGRAMMQIVHDVAPGAELIFHTAFKGADEFADGILELVEAGADIIVDDINYFSEPFFQDGVVAQAVNAAQEEGVAYFSVAGNSRSDSYEAEFRPVEPDSDFPLAGLERYVFHDFNPGAEVDLFQSIEITPQSSATFAVQWDEPFSSAGGKGANSDLDLVVLDSNNQIVTTSFESNLGKDAVEIVELTNLTGEVVEYKLLVGQDLEAGGSTPNLIKYIAPGNFLGAEYFTDSPTLFGQSNAVGAEAVGAVDYRQTPAFGEVPAVLEDFSSVGGTPILFDTNGNRLDSPEIRQKPEIVAPDNGNTTFFFGNDVENDGFPNFPGTSAAASHAAGVAALLLDAAPDSSPEEIYEVLENTAINVVESSTGGNSNLENEEFNFATGNGLIQADLALQALVGNENLV